MKICPQCRTSYTDDDLKFCLQDGTPLVGQTASNDWSDSETLVNPAPDRMRVSWTNTAGATPTNPAKVETIREVAPPGKSKTSLIVALTALLTILIVAAALLGVIYFRRDGKPEIAENKNAKIVNTPVNVSNATPAPTANAIANVSPSPTVAPTIKPTLKPKEVEAVKTEVGDVINNWNSASENLDLDGHLSNYADTVDYYRAGRVGRDTVRADKERAFAVYDSIRLDISDLHITPDETGNRATAQFDKEWSFEGAEKNSSGKVRQQLQLTKINGAWRITGEKDLKVYYTSR